MARLPNDATTNVQKAREAALLAIETYNRPGTAFRSAGYIVLMSIAWTALFHAIFFKRKTKPYYRRRGSRRFERVDEDYKAWELAECLRQFYADQNPPVRKNLELFVGLRNKIEHRFLPELDIEIFGECQAMLMNFEALLCQEFGDKHALASSLMFALQFSKSREGSQKAMQTASKAQLQSVRKYMERFRTTLSEDVRADQSFSFKVFLIPKVGIHAKTSDTAVEFIKYDPAKPEEMKQYERLVALIKPKHISVANLGGLKASEVVRLVADRLGKKFSQSSHTKCWKHFNTRPLGGSASPELCDNRYCYYDTVHKDYVYTSAWVDFLADKLSDAAAYELILHGVAPESA